MTELRSLVARMRSPGTNLATAVLVSPRHALTSTQPLMGATEQIRLVFPAWSGDRGRDCRVVFSSEEHGIALLELERAAPLDLSHPQLGEALDTPVEWTSRWFTASDPLGIDVAGTCKAVQERTHQDRTTTQALSALDMRPKVTVGHVGAPLMVGERILAVFAPYAGQTMAEERVVTFARPLAPFLAEHGEEVREILQSQPEEWTTEEVPLPPPSEPEPEPEPEPEAAPPEPEPEPEAAPPEPEPPRAPETPPPPVTQRTPSYSWSTPSRTPTPRKPAAEPKPRPRPVPSTGGSVRGLARIDAFTLSSPHHPEPVEIAPFYMQVRPVTQREYAEFVAATRAPAPLEWLRGRPEQAHLDLPVVGITLAEARRYARHRGLRLPTHLEWEAALRAPDGRRFPWGEEFEAERVRGPGSGSMAPAGSLPAGATPAGILDLVGNVWEWTEVDDRVHRPPPRGYSWAWGGSYRHPCVKEGHVARTEVAMAKGFTFLGFRCARDA